MARSKRWPGNLGLILIGAVMSRLILALAALEASLFTSSADFGLFNQVAIPSWVAILISIILLDLAVYFQHRIFHAVPALWRLHKIHHADLDLDVTSGLRFHPAEIGISLCIKLTVIAFLGAPAISVVIFEILLNGMAMFNHANLKIPKRADRIIRMLFVTPDMHRVHHSTDTYEHNKNFGFNLSFWDYCFRTYRARPKLGHRKMQIGLVEYPKSKCPNQLWSMLKMPFSLF